VAGEGACCVRRKSVQREVEELGAWDGRAGCMSRKSKVREVDHHGGPPRRARSSRCKA
jgi:hypothetical protein